MLPRYHFLQCHVPPPFSWSAYLTKSPEVFRVQVCVLALRDVNFDIEQRV